ncbi:ThuA domain-containing protein [Aquimarina sp. RZ0]|uniref:ThuA domain-containing protein n=1 Tax=Aquimarina sp. RZ0 TaxID=2607730 RepID=UPI002106356D|nr:ThuA domain-containing protein [Aquimarina sp. RZ0]
MLLSFTVHAQKPSIPLKALILDGSNNHYVWPKTSLMMKDYLEKTGLFEVSIARLDTIWKGFKYFPNRPEPHDFFITEFPVDSILRPVTKEALKTTDFEIDFKKYDLIVSNLGAFTPVWSNRMKRDFEKFMKAGGGLVVIHSANNAWGDWEAYNTMIGLGAWGRRDVSSGAFVYVDETGEVQKDFSPGVCGSHGQEHEFVITNQQPNHPILKGLPEKWLHAKDELYDRMRGPFENATILATAYSDAEINKQPYKPVLPGTGKNVPILMVIDYGKGRIFHSTLGHFDYSMECVGFITTFQRGAEWAATGKVTQKKPQIFPKLNESKSIKWILDNE